MTSARLPTSRTSLTPPSLLKGATCLVALALLTPAGARAEDAEATDALASLSDAPPKERADDPSPSDGHHFEVVDPPRIAPGQGEAPTAHPGLVRPDEGRRRPVLRGDGPGKGLRRREGEHTEPGPAPISAPPIERGPGGTRTLASFLLGEPSPTE